MYFDRFDICEAYYVLAHDYGMYGIISRLERMGYRPSPMAGSFNHLTENGQEIYLAAEARIEIAGYGAVLR